MTTRKPNETLQLKDDDENFPHIPVRSEYRTIDINIMECLVVMESVYKWMRESPLIFWLI